MQVTDKNELCELIKDKFPAEKTNRRSSIKITKNF